MFESLGPLILVFIVGLSVWLKWQKFSGQGLYGPFRHERDRILELQQMKEKRQLLIDDAARLGSTVSTDLILKHVEDLKKRYVDYGEQEAARKVEKTIREFREQNGPEIPVHKAYALMKELEDNEPFLMKRWSIRIGHWMG
jgi:hypothetical protein